MLENVAQFEGMNYENEILEYIAKEARGVPRDALVWLKKVADDGTWLIEVAEEITGSALGEDDPNIIEISRALIRGSFKNATKVYDKVKKKSQAESVRLGAVSYFVGCLKRAKSYPEADKFSAALDVLTQPIYEQGKPGDWKFYHMMYKAAKLLRK